MLSISKDDRDAHINILKKLHGHLSQLYNKKVKSLSTLKYQNYESWRNGSPLLGNSLIAGSLSEQQGKG